MRWKKSWNHTISYTYIKYRLIKINIILKVHFLPNFISAPRSAAVAIATFVNWTGNLLVGLIFPKMQEQIQEFSFLPFTIILVVLLGILFYYLPETKGIPVNEIEALFQVLYKSGGYFHFVILQFHVKNFKI